MELEGSGTVTVDLSDKLHTMKYSELAYKTLFNDVKTGGDYVIWGGGRLRPLYGTTDFGKEADRI